MGDVPPSRELEDEVFWRAGGGFRWCWPKFNLLHTAERRTHVALNRYPHNVIGAYAVIGRRGVGVRWKSS